MAAKPVMIEALAFNIAFSTKVEPVSSTSGISMSLHVTNVLLELSNIFKSL